MHTPLEICTADQRDHEGLASLYAEAGYRAAIGADDIILVARTSGRIVGAVRLCSEEGVMVLRGMQVRAGYQRQGIGAMLLAACQPFLEQAGTFCLPYAHLVPFYARLGFAPVHSAALPDFLARRLASYLAQGQDVLAMHRSSPASPLRR